MPFRLPPQVRQRLFSTTTRARTALPTNFHTASEFTTGPTGQKLGRLSRWYLPTMAALAVGMIYLPISASMSSSQPIARHTITLNEVNRHIYRSVTNALGEHNDRANQTMELPQEERNRLLMDAYGERSSLEDMERAIAGLEAVTVKPVEQAERNRVLEEAYGERTSLRDVEKAMEMYEVQ